MSKNRTVWVIDFSNMSVFSSTLKTTSSKTRSASELDYCVSLGGQYTAILQGIQTELRNEERYGWAWAVPTNNSMIYVASSEEQCISFLRSRIQENKQDIAKCDRLLEIYDADCESVVRAVQEAISVPVVVGEESSDNVHAGYFHTDRLTSYTQAGKEIRSVIESCVGMSLNQLPNVKITLNLSRYYVNFYIDKNTTDYMAGKYNEIEPVAGKLEKAWRLLGRGFDIHFVHSVPVEIDHTFFRRGPKYLAADFTHQDLDFAIRRQLANVIATSGRTNRRSKSKSNPIQFVLSPEAAKSIDIGEHRNSIVLEYSSVKNPMDDGKYYGLTRPLTVYCHGRPDGTIHLMSESLPENTLVLSREQYIEQTNRPTSILDTLMRDHT